MELEQVTNLILNTGVTAAVIIYFMYRDSKFLSNLDKTLVTLVDTVNALKELVEKQRKEEAN